MKVIKITWTYEIPITQAAYPDMSPREALKWEMEYLDLAEAICSSDGKVTWKLIEKRTPNHEN